VTTKRSEPGLERAAGSEEEPRKSPGATGRDVLVTRVELNRPHPRMPIGADFVRLSSTVDRDDSRAQTSQFWDVLVAADWLQSATLTLPCMGQEDGQGEAAAAQGHGLLDARGSLGLPAGICRRGL